MKNLAISLAAIAILGMAGIKIVCYTLGISVETLTAVDLPGFTQSKKYLAKEVDGKFIVVSDNGEVRTLSPWHFGHNRQ